MPLDPDVKLISIDDHVHEHPRVWQDRLPAKYREAGPHVVEADSDHDETHGGEVIHVVKGAPRWVYEDTSSWVTGMVVFGPRDEDKGHDPVPFDAMRPGCYDPVARLDDMDLDGVWAQAPFPSFPGFAGNRFLFGKDKELARLCVQAYNDFILDEWRAAAPERYIGVIILPLWDIAACVSEIHRSAAKGARAISFPDAPAHLDLPSFHGDDWDPVFAACEETAMPLLMHFGGSRLTPWLSPDAPAAVRTTLFGATLYNSMTELAYSRVFTKHPQLQVAFAEGGIGWIPYAMMRMDQVWEHYRNYKIQPTVPNPDLRPSDLVRRHVWGCFIDDPVGLANREVIGVDRLLWESDYPHADSLWPHSREHAEKVFADIPSDEVRRIVCDNARELFRLDVASS